MYVYYEYLKDASGNIVLTHVVFSSDGKSKYINWLNAIEAPTLNLLKQFLLSLPLKLRNYDASTYIWTIFDSSGPAVVDTFKKAYAAGLLHPTTAIKEIVDLEQKVNSKTLNRTTAKVEPQIKFKEEDFFYKAPSSLGAGLPTGEALYSALSTLLLIPVEEFKTKTPIELKSVYRKAALRLHPDRNNGDSTQMSELNMLWSAYNAN